MYVHTYLQHTYLYIFAVYNYTNYAHALHMQDEKKRLRIAIENGNTAILQHMIKTEEIDINANISPVSAT